MKDCKDGLVYTPKSISNMGTILILLSMLLSQKTPVWCSENVVATCVFDNDHTHPLPDQKCSGKFHKQWHGLGELHITLISARFSFFVRILGVAGGITWLGMKITGTHTVSKARGRQNLETCWLSV